ncbi:MAG: DMT family transporter [Candidatus Marinimicrobia bacterium]|nr:DMT family transporter [Candidatus Neomarinimicrobiota bacterium]MBT3496727.1 DMT family transporter [Candidatus Neomarinimicrobiota bacterium]MBT3731642.1 DMT family transporter [Candidatus Neomarinimicrobiota bacterium]MBT4177577.1 DMT family transporter [Candidatus Neomarinimicrobiota bacterium]MBT4593191.1 DMT family transporter [Candidatus Neomarinimicrobiota bacterium]
MKNIIPPLAVICAALLWSLDGFLRQELHSISSFLIITIEHTFGAILFLPFLIKGWAKIKKLDQQGWISLLWISICGGILGTFFYTKALSYIDDINLSVVVLLQKFQPFFAIALASIILKEPITKRFLGLAGLAMIGGYLLTFGANPISQWNDKMIIAALLALLAAFSWGSSTVLGKHALNRLPFTVVTALRLTLTAAVAGIVLLYTQENLSTIQMTMPQWKVLLIIVFSTGSVALFIYYYGLQRLPASHTSIYELFWPISAMAFDWVFRGKTLEPIQIGGAILLLGAIILLTQEKIIRD